MPPPRVLVVAETPSLARSLSYLLESAGIATDTVPTLEGPESKGPSANVGDYPLIIAASNGPFCSSARRWAQGGFTGSELIVVGSRDPALGRSPEIRQVGLPLRPGDLLELVRERLASGTSS